MPFLRYSAQLKRIYFCMSACDTAEEMARALNILREGRDVENAQSRLLHQIAISNENADWYAALQTPGAVGFALEQ